MKFSVGRNDHLCSVSQYFKVPYLTPMHTSALGVVQSGLTISTVMEMKTACSIVLTVGLVLQASSVITWMMLESRAQV